MATANGGFETGDFTNWQTIGNANIAAGTFGVNPTEGTFQASLATDQLYVGNDTWLQPVSDTQVESFLELNPGTLDNLGNGDVTEASAIKYQPITVKAGDVVFFDWDFLTIEPTPSTSNDFAFVSIGPGSVLELADTNSNFSESFTYYDSATGYQPFSYQFQTAGTYTIGMGVVNAGINSAYSSGLLVDNLNVVTPINGTSGNDALTGTADVDYIVGSAGDDTITGLAGSDRIFGDDGADILSGGEGYDRIEAGAGADQINGDGGNDIILGGSGLNVIHGGDGNDVVTGGLDAEHLYGDAGDDEIKGDSGNDAIEGGAGRDAIYGGQGEDSILGNLGQDNLYGDDGNDYINGGADSDVIDGGNGNDYLVGEAGLNSLAGDAGVDTLIGGVHADHLSGGFGSDILNAGDGDDHLYGSFGTAEIDTLTGGRGKDYIILGQYYGGACYDDRNANTRGESDYALITDFNPRQDIIELSGSFDFYRLNFIPSGSGTTNAELIYNPGTSAVGEVIAVLQNVSPTLKIDSHSFVIASDPGPGPIG